MKKRLSSIFVAILMLIVMIQPACFVSTAAGAVWDGSKKVPSISSGEYQISLASELAWFAEIVNSGNTTLKARLIDDIILNEGTPDSSWLEWTPIGTQDNPFKGSFNGAGFTISGLYINNTSDNQGLFGYVYKDLEQTPEDTQPGEEEDDEDEEVYTVFDYTTEYIISDVSVENASVSGGQYVGGIIGYCYNYGISGCSFDGVVSASQNNVGGIAGYLYAKGVIRNSSASGAVTGSARAGGITGYANSNAVVDKCFSNASVSANTYAGGIVGTSSGSKVLNSYNRGAVHALTSRSGGLVGYNAYGTVINCYTTGEVTCGGNYLAAAVGQVYGGEIRNVYYNVDTVSPDDEYAIARMSEDMLSAGFIDSLNDLVNPFVSDYTSINGGYPVLAWQFGKTLWTGDKEKPGVSGDGYYVITTGNELAWFADLVKGSVAGLSANPNANARLDANILLNVGVLSVDESRQWSPIGTSTYPYAGNFDGNGYAVTGVFIESESSYQGLFGKTAASSIISNLTVLDSYISANEFVGGVAGYNAGIILSCSNNSEIKGNRYVGGISGYNYLGGEISTCYNVGKISGLDVNGGYIGGIVGNNMRATITQCFNSGKITGDTRYVGGIAGSLTGEKITNCYNTGVIDASYNVGGIAGYVSGGLVLGSYNASKVSGITNYGAFIGTTAGTCTLTNCYYDSTVADISDISGAAPLNTAQMTGSTALVNLLGFSPDLWAVRADDTYFRYYPQITALSSSQNAVYKNDSIQSSRRLKAGLSVKVDIDGQVSTYFTSIYDALTYIGPQKGTVTVLEDITLTSPINIESNITIMGDDSSPKIKRGASTATGYMINVNNGASLTLGSYVYGDDDNIDITISGEKETYRNADSAIFVGEEATFIMYPGACIENNFSADEGGGIYNDAGNIEIHGGYIRENISVTNGGGIYNLAGTVTVSGGYISSNTNSSGKGGGIYNYLGDVVVSGGKIINNTSNSTQGGGGGIYNASRYATLLVKGSAEIAGNTSATNGAGVANESGTFTMSSGSITGNLAYNYGGGVYNSGTFTMTGGQISENTALLGTGVYQNGVMEVGSGAAIDAASDIYLIKGKTINIVSRLDSEGTAFVITPSEYTAGIKVLSGDNLNSNYNKFDITQKVGTVWSVNSGGFLVNSEVTNVAVLSTFGAHGQEFITLDAAIAAAGTEPSVITMIGDVVLSSAISINSGCEITIMSETDEIHTIRRGGTFKGNLFEVKSGGVLKFGLDEVAQGGTAQTESEASTMLFIDGSYSYNGATGNALVNVASGGTLEIYDGATLCNNYGYSTVSAIAISGTVNVFGGIIKDNVSRNGGAFNVSLTGTLNLYDGLITNNRATSYGGAIYNIGTLNNIARTYNYYKQNALVSSQQTKVKIDTNNDIYLPNSMRLNIYQETVDTYLDDEVAAPAPITAPDTEIRITPYNYDIGRVILSGTNISACHESYVLTNTGYVVDETGKIATILINLTASSTMTIDRSMGFLSSIALGSKVSDVRSGLIGANLVFTGVNGNTLSSNDKVTTGVKIELLNGSGTATDTLYIVLLGDVNCDGFVDGRDAVLTDIIRNGFLETSPSYVLEAADVTRDGEVNLADYQLISDAGIMVADIEQIY